MKRSLLLALGILASLGIATNAMALPFTSTGWVDPNYNNSWNAQTLSGTARYYFYWDNSAVTVNEADIEFEGDVFNLAALDASDFTVRAPAGWTTEMFEEAPGVYNWSLSSGTGISAAQGPIMVDVNYTLLSNSRFYYGDSSFAGDSQQWDWLEAQGANNSWSQKYELSGGKWTSGGSTAPVPEPATFALLGMGVLGLIGMRKKA